MDQVFSSQKYARAAIAPFLGACSLLLVLCKGPWRQFASVYVHVWDLILSPVPAPGRCEGAFEKLQSTVARGHIGQVMSIYTKLQSKEHGLRPGAGPSSSSLAASRSMLQRTGASISLMQMIGKM